MYGGQLTLGRSRPACPDSFHIATRRGVHRLISTDKLHAQQCRAGRRRMHSLFTEEIKQLQTLLTHMKKIYTDCPRTSELCASKSLPRSLRSSRETRVREPRGSRENCWRSLHSRAATLPRQISLWGGGGEVCSGNGVRTSSRTSAFRWGLIDTDTDTHFFHNAAQLPKRPIAERKDSNSRHPWPLSNPYATCIGPYRLFD
eukprot:scaffold11216_cov126-Isochrysis_galbana.AAC.4